MRNIVLILATLVLTGTVFAQGPAPTPPSPDTRVGTLIYNQSPFTNRYFRLGTGADTNTLAITKFGNIKWLRPYDAAASGWRFGSPDYEWGQGYFDTIQITNPGGVIRMNNEYIYDLTGPGIINSGGQLAVSLPDLILGSWVIDQTLTGADIDSTSNNVVFDDAYRGTSEVTDSVLITKKYGDTRLGGLPFTDLVGDTTTYNDYIIAWDSTNHTWYVRPDASLAGTGDNAYYDIGAGNVALTDLVLKGSISVAGNEVTILGGNGRFGAAVDSTFNAANATIDSLEEIDVDTAHIDQIVAFPTAGGVLDSVNYIYGPSGLGLFLTPRSTNPIMMGYNATGGIRIYEGTTQSFGIDNNAITGNGSSTITGISSATIAGLTIDGTEDIVNDAELTPLLNAKVSTSNENWQDYLTGVFTGVRHTANGVNFDVLLTQAGNDTALIRTDLGSLKLQSGNAANDRVIIEGATGGITSFGSTVTHLNQNVDSIGTADADYLYADVALRLAATATGSYYTEFKAPAGQTQNYTYTWPNGYGTTGYVLSTNGAGGLSWVAGGTGGGGVPIYVNDGVTEYSPDAPLLTEGSGIALDVILNGGAGGKDQIAVSAAGLTEGNFATDAGITTEAEFATMLTADHVLRDEWSSIYNGTTYSDFQGSDTTFLLSKTGGGQRMMTVRAKHTGADTTFIEQDAGDGLVLGIGGSNSVTLLDADTTRLKSTAALKFTGSANMFKSTTLDSLTAGMPGWYTLSAGAGDISAVGSMTGGDAFAGVSADEDWLGLGASGGRIQFELDGGTGGMDDIEILDANLTIGARMDAGKTGLLMYNTMGSSGQDLGAWVEQSDSANGYNVRWDLVARSNAAGTTGGDPSFSFGSYDAGLVRSTVFNVGLDRSDAFRFKIVKSNTQGLSTTGDYFIMDTLGKTAITGGLYLDDGSMTADSQAATMGFVKKRLPFYQTARDINWNYPTVAADTSQHATFPYSSGITFDTTVLTKCSTTVGNDTLFGLVIPFFIEDSTTVDSLILFTKMSTATATDAKIDSIHMTYETADAITVTALPSYATDIGGTTNLTRTAIGLSRTALPGDIIRVRPAVALKAADATCIIYKAQIKGSKR